MQGPFILTTVGGKTIKRSQEIRRLLPDARQVMAEGWPVFIRSGLRAHNSVEYRLGEDNTVSVTPHEFAEERWVAWVMANFMP